MNILFIPIVAVLIGYFVRSRLSAVVLFLAIVSIFFTFQTLAVLLAWMAGDGGFGGATDQGLLGRRHRAFHWNSMTLICGFMV